MPFHATKTDTHNKATRANEDYIGEYNHPAFGTYNVFQNISNEGLHYTFGLLLKGNLNPSGTQDMFHMTLDYPISYRMTFFPQYPDGFPVYFSSSDGGGVIDTVQVPYLEFDLPPVFVKATLQK